MSSSSNNSNNSRGGRGGRGRGHGRVGGRDRGGRALQEKNWRDTRPTVPKVADEVRCVPHIFLIYRYQCTDLVTGRVPSSRCNS